MDNEMLNILKTIQTNIKNLVSSQEEIKINQSRIERKLDSVIEQIEFIEYRLR